VFTELALKTGHPNCSDTMVKDIRKTFRSDELMECAATYKDVLECACLIFNSIGYDVGTVRN
jgi:hypothetical protein